MSILKNHNKYPLHYSIYTLHDALFFSYMLKYRAVTFNLSDIIHSSFYLCQAGLSACPSTPKPGQAWRALIYSSIQSEGRVWKAH